MNVTSSLEHWGMEFGESEPDYKGRVPTPEEDFYNRELTLIVALLICYLIYAVIYILNVQNSITKVTLPDEEEEDEEKEFYSAVLDDKEKAVQNEEEEEKKIEPNSKSSFSHWVLKSYQRNMFFFTVCIGLCLEFYNGHAAIALVYVGILCKLTQLTGLFLSKEILCQISHACVVMINSVLIIINIIKIAS